MSDDLREQIREAIASNLTSVYLCGRVWSAWSYGTMSEDDFIPAVNSETFLDYMADAIFKAVTTQLEQAKADAARYRWLRDPNNQLHEDEICVSDSSFNACFEDELDAAIERPRHKMKKLFKRLLISIRLHDRRERRKFLGIK